MPWVSFLIYCSAFYELAIIEAFFVPLRINFENFEILNIYGCFLVIIMVLILLIIG